LGKINLDNLRKTVYYLKKNGVKNTVLAAAERLQKREYDNYTYIAPAEEELAAQRRRIWNEPVKFSIVVPLYHTPEKYFRELLESVLGQTYPYFELILADASRDERLRELAESYGDLRVRYRKLSENAGISENTNQGILEAEGEYVALLDHDDLLTPDALYEMAAAIQAHEAERIYAADVPAAASAEIPDEKSGLPVLLYSDEDKCSGDGSMFYEPHYKQDYNEDLLLTNNYLCHFTAIRTDVAKRLLLRKEYDGAQDFDLVLRVAGEAGKMNSKEGRIVHIPKVLYHWRCHTGSTAANPESKRYAYEAGKRAVQDYVNQKKWAAEVHHLKHLGFYRVEYKGDIFDIREDIGAVGGRVLHRGKIVGGMMNERGDVSFAGLQDGYSGYVNRAALVQQAGAMDVRCMRLSPACRKIVQEKISPEQCFAQDGTFLWKKLPPGTDYVDISLNISRMIRAAGYVLLWDPEQRTKL